MTESPYANIEPSISIDTGVFRVRKRSLLAEESDQTIVK